MKFSDIEILVSEVLSDVGTITYTVPQIRRWTIDAELALVGLIPESNTVTEVMPCAAGTLQTIPSGCIKLHSVIKNMGDGSTPGRAIRLIDRATKDDMEPDWHAATPKAVIKEYIYDDRSPTKFMNSPPLVSGVFAEIECSKEPEPYDIEVDETLAVSNIYQPALVEWVLYRCFSRSDEDTPEYTRAHAHYAKFLQLIGIKAQVDKAVSPKTRGHLN